MNKYPNLMLFHNIWKIYNNVFNNYIGKLIIHYSTILIYIICLIKYLTLFSSVYLEF